MILHVGDEDTEWNELPHKFEAGTQDIAGVIGLGAAIDYLETLGRVRIEQYEQKLNEYILAKLSGNSWSKTSWSKSFLCTVEPFTA